MPHPGFGDTCITARMTDRHHKRQHPRWARPCWPLGHFLPWHWGHRCV